MQSDGSDWIARSPSTSERRMLGSGRRLPGYGSPDDAHWGGDGKNISSHADHVAPLLSSPDPRASRKHTPKEPGPPKILAARESRPTRRTTATRRKRPGGLPNGQPSDRLQPFTGYLGDGPAQSGARNPYPSQSGLDPFLNPAALERRPGGQVPLQPAGRRSLDSFNSLSTNSRPTVPRVWHYRGSSSSWFSQVCSADERGRRGRP